MIFKTRTMIKVLLLLLLSVSVLANELSQGVDLPVSRKDFLKLVPQGLSRSDLVEKIGPPSGEKTSQVPHCTNLLFRNIIRSTTGGTEGVTIIIFNDYDNVYSVIWSDGTEAEW